MGCQEWRPMWPSEEMHQKGGEDLFEIETDFQGSKGKSTGVPGVWGSNRQGIKEKEIC